MNDINANLFPPPDHPDFTPVPPDSPYRAVLARHWGAPLQFTDESRKILNVYPDLTPLEMGGKL
ncbi:hypothetical protein GYMLUDRAFT_435583 [Collybiopsis luxurians FD-317 M1]|uniref:Unplaced genomic scaffold GYMLUscaffold_14, whole genome shotgun sequence n=1 Tax=Collybiopsis luxurians FD-317 M1 TaxID=944289 RepID=A0A0D0CWH5_9AGAR|nr:hypothetical protein GYMLUDRAFT_435583 [Collybiopsis luxurians FD-317 M1]